VARIPRAGDSHRDDPARAEQNLERIGDLGRPRAAGRGIAQARKITLVDYVQVHVHVQRPLGQGGGVQVGDLGAADRRVGQVGHLGRVEVPGPHEENPVLGHRPQVKAGRDQFGPVSGQQPQRKAAQVARCGRLEGLHVAVRVEPDDPDVDSGVLRPGDGAQ
jgi:hypothetical protein